MTSCMVAVEDDFTGSGQSSVPANSHQFEMNPQQSSHPAVASYGPGPGGFYQGPPGSFPGPGGGPGAYPGPMSPYGGGQPMSPYQAQQPPNGAGGPGAAMYGNQNSPLYNQNQSSSGYPTSGPGTFSSQAPGGFPGGPGASSMQSYYNNHSPTSGHPPGQYQYGVGPSPVRLSPPPMNMMGLGARIPQPTMNSPNQNVVTGGNQMKTENLDLNKQQQQQGYAPVTQGFSGPGGYGYNGHYSQVPARPLVSPMSPHGGPGARLNISPGGPNLSPREAPPNSLYPGGQPSPGPAFTGYQAQYSEYFSKQQSQSGHSPLSSGSGGYTGGGKEEKCGYQGDNSSTQGDKMSDVQSNAGSVRSSEGGPGGGDTPGCEDTGPSLTALTSAKEKADKTGDSDNDNKFTPKSEPDDPSSAAAVKTEPGSYFDEQKDFTLKANQTLIDNMNMDSIPELPEIPELKYEDMSEMRGLHHPGDSEAVKKETPPGLSPDLKEGQGGLSRGWGEEGAETEEGYMGGWGHGMPGQDGMEQGYPGHQMGSYPNQQQMWANFYGSGGGPPGSGGGGEPGPRYPHLPPHMGGPGPMEPGAWWQSGGHPGPDLGPYRMGAPGPGMPPAPGPWALRGPRPRGERRGPGRPRLTNKAGGRGQESRPPSAGGLPGAQFPGPYPDTGGLPPDMMPDHKRGPGRPKAMLDPNSPKVPGETTKNGNKKRYSCEVCQKRFSTAWYVRVHRRSHNGERPYVCNNCGKGFMLPNVLQVHLRKCEKNNPPAPAVPRGSTEPGLEAPSLEAPNQSPNSTNSGPAGFRPGPGPYTEAGPGGQPPAGGHPGYPGPGPMGGYNQRYLAGMGSPPLFPGPGLGDMAPPGPGSAFPGDPGYPGLAPPPPHSPHSGGLDRSPPPGAPGSQFSPMYSPNSNQLPLGASDSEHHFLANDKPRDQGGGPGHGSLHSSSDLMTSTSGGGGAGEPSSNCEEDKSVLEELKTHRPFTCEICDKRFTQKCNLVTHMRLHTGDKPYKCDFCDKRFTQKGNLDAHIKTHTKDKPLKAAFKSSMTSRPGHQNGVMDMDHEDLDMFKQQVKARVSGDSLDEDGHEDEDEEDEDHDPEAEGLSPHSSVSPSPLPQFGATIQQFNSQGLSSSPENDISSKLTDSRQTVAMLQ